MSVPLIVGHSSRQRVANMPVLNFYLEASLWRHSELSMPSPAIVETSALLLPQACDELVPFVLQC